MVKKNDTMSYCWVGSSHPLNFIFIHRYLVFLFENCYIDEIDKTNGNQSINVEYISKLNIIYIDIFCKFT